MDNERFEDSNEGFEDEEASRNLDEYEGSGPDIEIEARDLLSRDYVEPINPKLSTDVMNGDLSYDVLSENFICNYPIYYDGSKIWWVWDKNEFKWIMKDEVDIVGHVKNVYNWSELNKTHIRSQFIFSLKTVCRLNIPDQPPVEWVQFKDIIVDVLTNERIKPTPKYLFTNPLPWSLGDSTETPVMDRLLKSWLNEDYDVGYEIIAYCLYRGYPIQRILAFVGSGSNGKGQFLNLLNSFLGNKNCTASDLDRLATQRFEASKLFKKLLCEIAEVNVNQISKTSNLKRLCGGDNMSCEFKRKDAFDFKNYSKIIIASNSLPMTRDRTDGFYRRWLILKFPNQFKDGKSIIETIPAEEYENLGLKCVSILKTLLERGNFMREGGIDARKRAYENLSNPLKGFIELFYDRDPYDYVIKQDFNDAFWHYLVDNGFRQLSRKEINDVLRGMGYTVNKKTIEGQSVQCVTGLRKKEVKKNDVNTLLPPEEPDESTIKVSEKIINFINSGKPDCTQEQVIVNSVGQGKNINWSLVRKTMKSMVHNGVLAEVKAGVYHVI